MNSKKLFFFLLLVVLLFAVVKADDEGSKDVDVVEEKEEKDVEVDKKVEEKEEEEEEEPEEVKEEDEQEPVKEDAKPEPKPETKPTPKPTTKPSSPKPTPAKSQSNSNSKPSPKPVANSSTKPNVESKPVQQTTNTSSNNNKAAANSKPAQSNNSTPANNATPVNNAAPVSTVTPVAYKVTASAAAASTNAAIPQTNPIAGSASNISAAGANKQEENGGNGAFKGTVISIVAVGAVVGVATVGVRAYNKKSTEDNTRGADLGDIEAQPIKNDFGNVNDYDNGDYMAPEDYNPYNIMNDVPNEPYITNNPYEYKPNYDENVIDTTPFNKVETTQDNFMSRESIFSTSGNIPQIGNDVFNFGDNTQLPYQEHPIENSYIEEPVAKEIKIESYDAPNSQMPTLVPVQPEIVVTQPEEEPAQEGYKQIVPNVAQMEIIETPDFNNMTTSMIEDHINNMDLEQLANTETQQDEPDGGYKQIVPDIQEAVIENFEVDDDEEEQDMSVVDNITDTYRAALRATYCSTNDDNRFSYRTVDSDHSLLHNMRENGEW